MFFISILWCLPYLGTDFHEIQSPAQTKAYARRNISQLPDLMCLSLLTNQNIYNYIMKKSKYTINLQFQGTNTTFFIDPSSTVSDLKNLIFKELGVVPKFQVLNFQKDLLLDDSARFDDIGIKGNIAKIHLDQFEMEERSFQFNSLSEKEIRNFNNKAPEWRIIQPGVYLQAKCATQGCIAFGKKVLANKKFGKFDIGKEIHRCLCPKCNKKTEKATNLGYFGTKIKIEGTQEDGTDIKIQQKIGLDEYRTFSQAENLKQWSYIEVEASPL